MASTPDAAKQFLSALRAAGAIVWVDSEDRLLISPPAVAVHGYGDSDELEAAIDSHYGLRDLVLAETAGRRTEEAATDDGP